MNIARDSESLEQKMMRMSNAHNNLTMLVQQNAGNTQIFIDSLMKVLEIEIEDFKEKYTRAKFVVNLENLVEARLNAHLTGDLNGYAGFGEQLKAIRKQAKDGDKKAREEAKKDGKTPPRSMKSLYDKTMRRLEKMIQNQDFGDRNEDTDPKQIVGTPELEVIEISNKFCDEPEA